LRARIFIAIATIGFGLSFSEAIPGHSRARAADASGAPG
jgi:hypothetical protein